jgi:hypothetical protein
MQGTNIDVLSLDALQNQIVDSDGLSKVDKELVYNVIDHVNQQTKYMDDSMRKSLTVAEFIEKYHFTSSGNY